MSVTRGGVHMHVLPYVARKNPSGWQHGLFGCCNDIGLTFLTLFCPCVVAGLNAGAVGESCVLCGTVGFCLNDNIAIYSNIVIRGKIRKKFGIDGTTVHDCLVSACCLCCAFIQQRQEIKMRRALEDAALV